MSASPKKKPSQKASFIAVNNPEIFKIQPRPGGAVYIKPSRTSISSCKDSEKAAKAALLEEKISREFKVQTALENTGSIDSEEITEPHPLKDTMYLFGITISTLILLASGNSKLSAEYITWTKKCLECIKDDFGFHPPNVQGILNHLKYLEETNKIKTSDKDADVTGGERVGNDEPQEQDEGEEEGGEKTIRTTTRARLGSQEA